MPTETTDIVAMLQDHVLREDQLAYAVDHTCRHRAARVAVP
jgi:hypothetical protein